MSKENIQICLLGASFDTGNFGVNALTESSIKCCLHKWPNAKIYILGNTETGKEYKIILFEKTVTVQAIPIRYCKNIFLANHFLTILIYCLIWKLLPKSMSGFLFKNKYFAIFAQTDYFMDITGGDSFSDIYGMRRFLFNYSLKRLVLKFKKPFIMLPQTYGPFKGGIVKRLAKHIINKSAIVFSRDKNSIRILSKLCRDKNKIRLVPDVGFVLDSHKPDNFEKLIPPQVFQGGSINVGLNVSGLLFNGGYTKNNMFGLAGDYKKLIYKLMEKLLEIKEVNIILIPHVFTHKGCVENDPDACRIIYNYFAGRFSGRIFLIEEGLNHNEIKYIIGRCGFFIGSRMHACIAALSQNVPAVGLAYSRKFKGVFESVGLGKFVIDMKKSSLDKTIETIRICFNGRLEAKNGLSLKIEKAKGRVQNIFTNTGL